MSDQRARPSVSPILVAVVAWLLPGGGHLLLGQYSRGLTIGCAIILLFFGGLLVGGVRSLEVPGYNAHGAKQNLYMVKVTSRDDDRPRYVERISDRTPPNGQFVDEGWILARHPIDEIRSKPWSIPQVLVGPIDILCNWWSVTLSQWVVPPSSGPLPAYPVPIAARSHSRVNELGVLYTAVAGMLNLLAIIDSAHRASHTEAA